MFMNTAIDQQLELLEKKEDVFNDSEHARIRAQAMSVVRGTVQADILKEDQPRTPVFSPRPLP